MPDDYDLLDLITAAKNPALADEAYTYDDVGNRLTSAGTTGSWQYNNNNQLLNDTLNTYVYDSNGSQIKKTSGSDVQEFVYNLENRINTVKVNSVTTASYYYDPFGRRLWKEVGGVRTYALYAPEGMVAEYDNTGALVQSYGYVPEATYGTQPLFTANATTTGYYQLDQLGTPQQLMTSTGAVAWSAQYQAFGQASVTSSGLNNDLRFPGQRYDAETGLSYNYFRYYNAGVGRYVSSDPIGLMGGLNTFLYSDNNPMFFYDNFGLTSYPTEAPCRITSKYGWRIHPKKKTPDFHSAVDFGQANTSGKVYAVESGRVVKVGKTKAGTNYILVKDKNGFTHGYYHTTTGLKEKDVVNEGESIGDSDLSGYATGLHLHYTVQTGNSRSTRIDPQSYLEQRNPTTPGGGGSGCGKC